MPLVMKTGNADGRIGFLGLLPAVWAIFEYGRPPNPMLIPFGISAILFVAWLVERNKQWTTQVKCFLLLLVVMAIGVPLARNTYSAVWATYAMIVVLVTVVIPFVHVIDSLRKLRCLVWTMIGTNVYVGLFAIFHAGYGPAGSHGGQDENYVAAMMSISLPFVYFGILGLRGFLKRAVCAAAAGVFILASAVSLSRGGALAMGAVLLYGAMKWPRRWIGLTLVGALLGVVVLAGPGQYWSEVETISDTSESTADLRIELWKIATRMFLANPISGVGPGNFIWNIGAYQSAEQREKYGRELMAYSHSMYFELLADLGLAGTALVLLILFSTFRDLRLVGRMLEKVRRAPGGDHSSSGDEPDRLAQRDLSEALLYQRAISGGLVGALVAAAFLPFLYLSYVWVLTAMAMALRRIVTQKEAVVESPSPAAVMTDGGVASEPARGGSRPVRYRVGR